MTQYLSTRNTALRAGFIDVLMGGLAPEGGLYLPVEWPRLSDDTLRGLRGKPYADVAFAVLAPFVGGAIDDDDLKTILNDVYTPHAHPHTGGFRHQSVAPLVQLDANQWVMELFHGPTLAFKDVALQLLGRLFDHVLKARDTHMTIVGATSGDTGSAAIQGCKSCKNARIFILHPHNRTSEVQRRQMTTVADSNVFNIALDGTFDDCQRIVKQLFADEAMRARHNLSAINSINWARIMAQIVYYVSTALALGAPDRPVQFVVPTGNFGNIFAAYAAVQMGVPIKRLVIATNRNDILTRFMQTGKLTQGSVHPTISPSMDIQISSNFERYLFELMDRDDAALRTLMNDFLDGGAASVTPEKRAEAHQLFAAYAVDDAATTATIADIYARTNYTLDPHSAVGAQAMERALADGTLDAALPSVTLACAHPAKFPDAVKAATGHHPALPDSMADLFTRKERFTVLPHSLDAVRAFIDKAQ